MVWSLLYSSSRSLLFAMKSPPLLIHPGSIPVSASRFVRTWGHKLAAHSVTCTSWAHLVSVVQELDLGVAGSESPHQASSVPSGPLNTTFDPDTRHLSTWAGRPESYSLWTPSLDKMQLTMGYFDTDYLKCHFIRFSTKHDLKYYLVKPGNITSLQSFCFLVSKWWWWRWKSVPFDEDDVIKSNLRSIGLFRGGQCWWPPTLTNDIEFGNQGWMYKLIKTSFEQRSLHLPPPIITTSASEGREPGVVSVLELEHRVVMFCKNAWYFKC